MQPTPYWRRCRICMEMAPTTIQRMSDAGTDLSFLLDFVQTARYLIINKTIFCHGSSHARSRHRSDAGAPASRHVAPGSLPQRRGPTAAAAQARCPNLTSPTRPQPPAHNVSARSGWCPTAGRMVAAAEPASSTPSVAGTRRGVRCRPSSPPNGWPPAAGPAVAAPKPAPAACPQRHVPSGMSPASGAQRASRAQPPIPQHL